MTVVAETRRSTIVATVAVVLVAALVGLMVGTRVGASGTSLPNVTMAGGDNVHVTCAEPSISIANQTTSPSGPSSLDATCTPPPSTTTTTKATTTTTGATTTTTSPAGTPVAVHLVAHRFAVSPVTVAVISTSPELAVAFVSADTVNSGAGQTATVDGGGLAWVSAGRANTASGDAEVWWAKTAGANFSATATAAGLGKNLELTVVTFTGASSIGATQSASAAQGPPTVTLTPSATGSLVFGVGFDFDTAIPRTVGTGESAVAQDTDTAGDTYWVQQANANTAAGAPVTIDDTSPTGDQWNLLAVEITRTASPVSIIDPASPPFAPVTNNVSSVTTANFNPPAGTVLYAVFSMDSLPGSAMNVASVTNSGAPLAWKMINLENHSGVGVGGFVEVFYAANPNGQTGVAVTGTFNLPSKDVAPPVGGLQILVMDHAAADQSAAASTAAWNVTTNSTPTVTLTTTAASSWVFGVFDNWDSSADPTVGAGQTLVTQIRNDADQDTYWVQRFTAPTATAGTTVTVNDTSPSNIRWHAIAWEVRAG